jgi:hypothetical protein
VLALASVLGAALARSVEVGRERAEEVPPWPARPGLEAIPLKSGPVTG